jgi:hypothetical protein
VDVAINSFTDLYAFNLARTTGNQDLMSAVVEDVNDQRSKMWLAVADLSSAELGGYFGETGEMLGALGSTVSSLVGTAVSLNTLLEQVDSTELSIFNEFSPEPIELGIQNGHTDVSGNAASTGWQYGERWNNVKHRDRPEWRLSGVSVSEPTSSKPRPAKSCDDGAGLADRFPNQF